LAQAGQVRPVDGDDLAHLRDCGVQAGGPAVDAGGEHVSVLPQPGRESVAAQCDGAQLMASRGASCSPISRQVRV
jgi:hypothetical protein